MENKYQKAKDRINTWCHCFPKTKLERQRLDEAFEILQEAINELEEYKKYIPNLEELHKWCKGDYLQREGMNLKSQALKESEDK